MSDQLSNAVGAEECGSSRGGESARNSGHRAWILFLIFALIVHAVVSLYLAYRMPLFSPIDEKEHVDYCLKLARYGNANPDQRLETDLFALACEQRTRASLYYNREEAGESLGYSYESFHPPLFYQAGRVVLRIGEGLGFDLENRVLLLRLFCATLSILSRVFVFLALCGLNRRFGVIALPFLLFNIPVDCLRVSNDALMALLGALSFFTLSSILRGNTKGSRKAWLCILLMAAVGTKATAVLYLLPAVFLSMMVLPRALRGGHWGLVAVFVPPTAMFVLLTTANLLLTGSFTGALHLDEIGAPRPEGSSYLDLFPSVGHLYYWLLAFFTNGPVSSANGSLSHLLLNLKVTLYTVGAATGIVLAVFCPSNSSGTHLEAVPDLLLRRLVLGGFLAVIACQLSASAAWHMVGGAYPWMNRLFLPLDFLVLFVCAYGYHRLYDRVLHRFASLSVALWVLASSSFLATLLPYAYPPP